MNIAAWVGYYFEWNEMACTAGKIGDIGKRAEYASRFIFETLMRSYGFCVLLFGVMFRA